VFSAGALEGAGVCGLVGTGVFDTVSGMLLLSAIPCRSCCAIAVRVGPKVGMGLHVKLI